MSSTLTVRRIAKKTVVETFSTPPALPGDDTATFGPADVDETFDATSSPTATKHAEFTVTLSSGAATIDLTALPGKTADETVNLTGLKLTLLRLKPKAANANKITASQGASNAWRPDAATNWSLPLVAGQDTGPMKFGTGGDTVGSGRKNIDLAGTGSQQIDVEIVGGS